MSHRQSSSTIIPDPYEALSVRDRQTVIGYLTPEVHQYFTRKVFAGTKGCMNATMNTLLEALRLALVADGITQYEPDNEQRVLAILQRVNFRPAAAKRPPSRRANLPVTVSATQPTDRADVPISTP